MANFILAQTQAAGGFDMSFILMMVLVFAVMYFFMIRPQQKRQKEMNKFRDSIAQGDKVITAGGIYGTVKSVDEGIVSLEVASNVQIKIDKAMIMQDPSTLVVKK